jgi:uncharacterized peroxidase-related enzyme
MPRFPLTKEADATDEVAEIYRDFRQRMGFPEVPNFLQIQGVAPSILAATWGLVEHVLLEGSLPRATKELIFLAVAMDRECEYCKEAHAACCRILGVDESTVQSVMAGLAGEIPADTRDVLRFAIKCSTAPQELDDQDFAILREAKLDSPQIFEVIATSALALYATTIADSTLIEKDKMFDSM